MPGIKETKPPFWAFKWATKRTPFEIVRVVEYSSKGVAIDRKIGSIFSGSARVQKKQQVIGYNTFRRRYYSVEKLERLAKTRLIRTVLIQ